MPTQSEDIFAPVSAPVKSVETQLIDLHKEVSVAKPKESKQVEFPKIQNKTSSFGMLKEAPRATQAKTVVVNPITQEETTASQGWNGVPFAVYRHFNVLRNPDAPNN